MPTTTARRVCPDTGTCHHSCFAACFRVRFCGPLSGVYPDDRWPEHVKTAHVPDPAGDTAEAMVAHLVAAAAPAPAPPPVEPEPGRRWVRSDRLRTNGWEVGAQGRACRYTIGPGHRECRRPGVARLRRGVRQWWGYCADHLYGQVLHDGVLWRQVAVDELNDLPWVDA